MKRYRLFILVCSYFIGSITNHAFAQNNKGINFQGIARDNNGYILPNKSINIRISIITDTSSSKIEYQEITPITTSVLGLFNIVVGATENNKIVSAGPFENINWSKANKYLQNTYNITSNIKIGQVLSGSRKSSAGFIFKYK